MRVKQDKWDSSNFTHPAQSGSNYVTYYFTHNKGRKPDLALLYDKTGASGIEVMLGFDAGEPSTYYGFEYRFASVANTVTMRIYRTYSSSTTTLAARFLWF